jgi:hypothetical protein
MNTPLLQEDGVTHVPALQLLQNVGCCRLMQKLLTEVVSVKI